MTDGGQNYNNANLSENAIPTPHPPRYTRHLPLKGKAFVSKKNTPRICCGVLGLGSLFGFECMQFFVCEFFDDVADDFDCNRKGKIDCECKQYLFAELI